MARLLTLVCDSLADGALLVLMRLSDWKDEAESRALTDLAADFDCAGVFLNDAVGNRKTETCAAADRLCREKRVVYFY